MKQLLVKLGFRFFWGKPLRIFLSLVLIAMSLAVSAVGLIIATYDYSEINRQAYYSEDFGEFYRPNKYMNFIKRDERGDESGLSLSTKLMFTRQELHALEERLDAIGQGYFATIQPYPNDNMWDVGPYRLFEHFDVEEFDPDVYDPSLYRLMDEDGNIAPFFVYDSDPEYLGEGLTEEELKHYRESCLSRGARTLYQGLSCYLGDEEDLALYGYTLHGKLPEGLNEIVIPQSIYNSFAAYGYIDRATGERAEINSYEDIIGKEIEMYQTRETGKTKIVGVLEIDYEAELYHNFLMGTEGAILDGAVNIVGLDNGCGPIFNLLVSRSYFDNYMPHTWSTIDLTYGDDSIIGFDRHEEWHATCVTVLKWSEPAIRDAYWEIAAEGLREQTLWNMLRQPAPYLGYSWGGFWVQNDIGQKALKFEPFTWTAYLSIPFTLLLTVYLVYATLYEKRRRLYILRCLGMSRGRTALMLAVPVLAFALLAGALALIGTAAVLPQMFSALEITVFETRFMIDIAGFTLTPLSCAYLILWPLLSGAAGVGLSMLSYNSVLRRASKGGKKK